jgi:hypothetical protein
MRLATLATMASRGGGPPYRLFGRVPLYRWGDVLVWAEARLTAPRCSTTRGDAAGAQGRAATAGLIEQGLSKIDADENRHNPFA